MSQWILLTYKVPTEPAARRVALWRRLKGLGAIYLQNGVCLLPRTDENLRRLKMSELDISEMGGESVLLDSAPLDDTQLNKVIERFNADRDELYREFIGRCDDFEKEIAKEVSKQKFTYAELEEEDTDLRKLQEWFERIKKLDFYDAQLATLAGEKLKACGVLLDDYARQVFEANEENKGG
ncbi:MULTISPECIES: Chromate resistance protein ChrB [Rhizobium]|uniref:Chromate resistance protein ChrB n=1 Tax=Rhizobium TaxID=379 RepID=UPI000B8414D1|nr:Chromate resistance protein ChrB [Rhizobium miluonense]